MGKSTVSTAIFNSKLLVYQSVIFGYNLHHLELAEVGMLPVWSRMYGMYGKVVCYFLVINRLYHVISQYVDE
jgi:hypothetical protein